MHSATTSKHKKSEVPSPFEQTYPSITKWVKAYGWIEIGQLDWVRAAMVRALDEGGMVWEGEKTTLITWQETCKIVTDT